MTRVEKYSADMLGWQRPPGPLRVWRVVDGRRKNEDGKLRRFSIQEIPEDRYDDLLELMRTKFLPDEAICQNSHILDDPIASDDWRKLWSFALQQGITVGAFLVEENNPRPTVVGANMLVVNCEAAERTLQTGIEFRADKTKKILELMHDLEVEKNPREIYGVDKFLTGFGLCVDPRYRGQRLGYELLKARDDIASAYDIPATSTVFSAPAAYESARRAGFETLIERDFVDIKNKDGTEMFPGIKTKCVKLMGKKFCHSPSAE